RARNVTGVQTCALPISWKTRPTTFARLCSGWRETFLPSMEMVPESTINRPEIELSNVDFPAPLEPITVTKSPGFRCRETSTSALRSRSEEHTSELQSRFDIVCRLLLEKKNKHESYMYPDT